MAVRIKLDILVLGKTVAELQQMVAEIDEESAGEGNGVDPENVDVMDVIGHIYTSDIVVDWEFEAQGMEDM